MIICPRGILLKIDSYSYLGVYRYDVAYPVSNTKGLRNLRSYPEMELT